MNPSTVNPPTLNGTVPPPKNGLGSNSNYALDDGCSDLVGLSVTITLTTDLVVASSTGPTVGCNLQLNCYSDQSNSAWQQYVAGLIGAELHGKINNWKSVGSQSPLQSLCDYQFPLTSVPTADTIPAGYQIMMTLLNDSNNNITGAAWEVINSQGTTIANVTQMITSIPGMTEADLAPIVACELVLVGPAGGHNAVLSSGAGTFVYASGSPMTVLQGLPSCVAHANGTAETANSVYGALAAGPATPITQTFGVSS
jgi:hypothetical protein